MVEHANKLYWYIQTYQFIVVLLIVVLLNRLVQREAEVDKAKKSNINPLRKFCFVVNSYILVQCIKILVFSLSSDLSCVIEDS